MSFTHTITRQWSRSGELPLSSSVSATGDIEVNISRAIPLGSTDYEITQTLDVSEMQSVFMRCDTACTVEFNSGGSPAFTITLQADVPVEWVTGTGTNPLTADVTAFFITVAGSGGDAQFEFRSLVNR